MIPKKNVWICDDGLPRTQRRGRYVATSIQHPSKNYPCVMRQAIELISKPGDTILDPLAGVGTTVVESLDLQRNAIGIEIEPHFAAIAQKNVEAALTRNPNHKGRIICSDSSLLSAHINDPVNHIVTSPPFTCELVPKNQHGLRGSRPKGRKYLKGFEMKNNIAFANPKGAEYSQAISRIYSECFNILPPNGKMAIVVRNPYRQGDEEDLIGETIRLCKGAGFQLKGKCYHVLSNVSLWRIMQAQRDKARILDYTEAVLVFQKPHGDRS